MWSLGGMFFFEIYVTMAGSVQANFKFKYFLN